MAAKKTAGRQSAPKKTAPPTDETPVDPADSPEAENALRIATEAALAEAAVRRDAQQSLADQGYTVTSTAEDPDRGFHFVVEKNGASSIAWMAKDGKLTLEGQ